MTAMLVWPQEEYNAKASINPIVIFKDLEGKETRTEFPIYQLDGDSSELVLLKIVKTSAMCLASQETEGNDSQGIKRAEIMKALKELL